MDSVITLSNAILLGRVLPRQPEAAMGLGSATAAGISILSVGEWVTWLPNHLAKGSAQGASCRKTPPLSGHLGGAKGYALGLPYASILLPSQGVILPVKFKCGGGDRDICSLPYPRKGGFGFVFSKEEGENKFVFLECLVCARHCQG